MIRFSTPPGSPASSRILPSISIESGVSCAGLTTIVHPAAIAGPTFRVPIASGKFHGVISRHGPTGWRIVSSRPWPLGAFEKRPSIRTASSANQRRNSAAYRISDLDSAIGLPISSVIRSDSSSWRSTIVSNARRRISPRSRGGVSAQLGPASTAASSASIASSGEASATSANVSPVAGSSTAKVPLGGIPPLAPDVQLLRGFFNYPMFICCGDRGHRKEPTPSGGSARLPAVKRAVSGAVVALAAVLAGCGGSSKTVTVTAPATTGSSAATSTASGDPRLDRRRQGVDGNHEHVIGTDDLHHPRGGASPSVDVRVPLGEHRLHHRSAESRAATSSNATGHPRHDRPRARRSSTSARASRSRPPAPGGSSAPATRRWIHPPPSSRTARDRRGASIKCSSAPTGITCKNSGGGGFFISIQGYRIY